MQGEICFSVARDLYNLIMTSVTQSFEACREKAQRMWNSGPWMSVSCTYWELKAPSLIPFSPSPLMHHQVPQARAAVCRGPCPEQGSQGTRASLEGSWLRSLPWISKAVPQLTGFWQLNASQWTWQEGDAVVLGLFSAADEFFMALGAMGHWVPGSGSIQPCSLMD